MPHLVLIRGLPGSGKSTMAKQKYPSYVHLEADMYHMVNGKYEYDPSNIKKAHQWCYDTAIVFLNNGHDVVISNTFTQHWELKPYLSIAESLTVVVCTGEYGSIHNVPEEVIQKMKDRWED